METPRLLAAPLNFKAPLFWYKSLGHNPTFLHSSDRIRAALAILPCALSELGKYVSLLTYLLLKSTDS